VNAQWLIDQGQKGREASASFYGNYDLGKNTNSRNAILVMYYALTTFSSVGFGDYSPQSSDERLFIVGVFLVQMIVFSAIVGQIGDHFTVWKESQEEYDN